MINFKSVWEGLKIRAKAVLTSDEVGEIEVSSVDNKTYLHNGSTRSPIVTEAHAAALTNKSIDANGTGNSISNLETADLAVGVLNTSSTLAAASDTQIPSALAVKTYVDNGLAAQNEASEISYDNTTSGLAATNVQAAIDEVEGRLQTAETDISNHISDTVDAHDASAISFVPVGAVAATDVQSAIAEVDSDLTAHLTDTVDAHDASAISVVPTGNLAASDAQSAFNELQSNVDSLYIDQNATDTALTNHITDTVDAHDASAISSVPAGNLVATDVQSALNELQSDVDTRATQASLIDHITDLVDAHAASAIGFTPTGSLSSTNVQSAIAEVDSDLTAHISDTTPHATISGSSIQDPTRLDVKKDTLANLTTYATTATNGQIVFATDVKEMYQIVDNALVAVGSGGGTGIGVNQIAVQTFDDAVVGDFTQTGLELVTSSTIHGGQTARLIHQASSNYSFKQLIDVDRKFRGKSNTLSLSGYSTASSSNVTVLVTDETNSATLLSSTFTTGQITSAVFNTASSTTVTVTDNSILNQLSVGARITGSGIPTGTTITAVNSTAGTITISNAATATATGVSLKVSTLPNIQSYAFDIPTNCSSISYTVTALQEAGSPETYVDDIVIELTDMAMTSTSVTVPTITEQSSFLDTTSIIGNVTVSGALTETKGFGVYSYNSVSGVYTILRDSTVNISASFKNNAGASPEFNIRKNGVVLASETATPTTGYTGAVSAEYSFVAGDTFDVFNSSTNSSNRTRVVVTATTYGTETKTIPLSSSVIVTEPDSYLRITGFNANVSGSTATRIMSLSSGIIQQNQGDAIQYLDDSVNGARFIAKKEGLFRFQCSSDSYATNGSIGFSLNSTNLTTDVQNIPASEKIAISFDGGNSATGNVFGEAYLKVGDVVRIHRQNAPDSSTAAYSTFTASYLGSTKILNPSSDQKVEIPTHELRFEGASARGSVATTIVKFDTLAKIKGDGFEVVNTTTDGTVIKVKKGGLLNVSASVSLSVAGNGLWITKNQAILNSSPVTSEILDTAIPSTNAFSVTSAISGHPVKAGDMIRVASSGVLSPSSYNMLHASLQEQSVAVALQNVAPRWDDSDSEVRVQGQNGHGSTNTVIRRFSNVLNNAGSAIEYFDSATLGAYFLIKETGEYHMSYSDACGVACNIGISKNSSQLTTNIASITPENRLALASPTGNDSFASVPWSGILQKGDIIRAHTDGSTATSSVARTQFTISKVGKTQGTVDVTPFVQIPQNEVEEVQLKGTAGYGSTATKIPYYSTVLKNTNRGILQITNDSVNGLQIRALKRCDISLKISASFTIQTNIGISKNSTQLTTNISTITSSDNVAMEITAGAGYTGEPVYFATLEAGDVLRPHTDGAAFANASYNTVSILATAISPSIATPTEQVSSDTIPFVFKATAITDSDPVGTFNTYTYAASTNTPTISATAPTQSTSSMNINGVQVFARAYNVTSTAAQPARVDIKIGKGLKSKEVLAYVGAAKTNPVSFNHWTYSSVVELGAPVLYNEVTGVLTIESAVAYSASVTNRFIGFDISGNGQTSAYFVFNASKSPSLVSIPNLQQRVAYLSDVKPSGTAGGSSVTGTQTRTLNTLVDNTGIVKSLASNIFTITAGTYKITASTPAFMANRNQARLRNTTDSVDVLLGTSEISGTGGVYSSTRSIISGEFTITSEKSFSITQYCETAKATDGLGFASSSGTSEVFTTVELVKIK